MNANRINKMHVICDFEKSLLAGSKVRVSWTNCGRFLSGLATVVKVNGKSIRVKLDEHVSPETYGGWPIGQVISAPLFMNDLWSINNRVEPVDGYTS